MEGARKRKHMFEDDAYMDNDNEQEVELAAKAKRKRKR